MKNYILIGIAILCLFLFSNCNKDITEPEHKANGSNVVYLRVDDKEEFLLENKNKRLHKKTAGKFDEDDDDIVKYDEYIDYNTKREVIDFSIYILPHNVKANLKKAALILRFNKQTQAIDTAFFREYLDTSGHSVVKFHAVTDEYREYNIDSIIDYKIIKLDTEKKIFTFSANCSYSNFPKVTPKNPRLYFYLDLKY